MKRIRLILDFEGPEKFKQFMGMMRMAEIIPDDSFVYQADVLDFDDGLKRVPGIGNTDWVVLKKDGDRPDECKFSIIKETKVEF